MRKDPLSVVRGMTNKDLISEADVISVDAMTRSAMVRLRTTSQTIRVSLGSIDPDSVLDSRARILVYLSPFGGISPVGVIQDRPTSASSPAVTLGDKRGKSHFCILNSDREPVWCVDSLGRTSRANIEVSSSDVSAPPTYAELCSAFGLPSIVGDGFLGLVNDGGLNNSFWLCAAIGTYWTYTSMGIAA